MLQQNRPTAAAGQRTGDDNNRQAQTRHRLTLRARHDLLEAQAATRFGSRILAVARWGFQWENFGRGRILFRPPPTAGGRGWAVTHHLWSRFPL